MTVNSASCDRILLKIGGAELQDGPILDELVEALTPLATTNELVIVHGGGRDIAGLQARLGVEPTYLDGLRVTDEDSLWIAEMALSGTVNKRLVARLVCAGVKALGLSGVDGGLMYACPLCHPAGDLGRVGEVTEVNVDLLTTLLGAGLTPVVSPISLGADGRPFNVNADHAAQAIAAALGVDQMVFLTDVPGVLNGNGTTPVPELSAAAIEAMIAEGAITGGMIPKVRSALDVVTKGVAAARITNLAGLAAGTGTVVR